MTTLPLPTTPADPVHADARLSRLASRIAGASRVFMRHDLDFCCGGNRTLRDACASAHIDLDALLTELRDASSGEPDDLNGWEERPLTDLIDHILHRYHEPLRPELDRLLLMAEKVLRVHGERDPERLHALVETTTALRAELLAHLQKEEQILFPWIASGRGASASAPIRVMLAEHDDAAQHLARLRDLTDHFQPPSGACTTWRALWAGLEALDADLRRHIHLENNVLFPRALNAA